MPAALNVVTPLIAAGASLDEAFQFYTGAMRGACSWRSDHMAGIERDGVAFHLVENTDRRTIGSFHCYE